MGQAVPPRERDRFSESLRRSTGSGGTYPKGPMPPEAETRAAGFPSPANPQLLPDQNQRSRELGKAKLCRGNPHPPIQCWGPPCTIIMLGPGRPLRGRKAGSPPSRASCLLWEVLTGNRRSHWVVRGGQRHGRRSPGCCETSPGATRSKEQEELAEVGLETILVEGQLGKGPGLALPRPPMVAGGGSRESGRNRRTLTRGLRGHAESPCQRADGSASWGCWSKLEEHGRMLQGESRIQDAGDVRGRREQEGKVFSGWLS